MSVLDRGSNPRSSVYSAGALARSAAEDGGRQRCRWSRLDSGGVTSQRCQAPAGFKVTRAPRGLTGTQQRHR